MTVLSKVLKWLHPKMWLVGDLLPTLSLPTLLGVFVFFCISCYVLKKFNVDQTVPVRDSTKNHSWNNIRATSKAWYCSICEALLLNGFGLYCDCCGVCADSDCIKKANLTLPCKAITCNGDSMSHQWVKGNLPWGAICSVCQDDCNLEVGLTDFQCCWCQRTLHEACMGGLRAEPCDLGRFRNLIVPPWCVQVARRKGAINKHLLLRGVKDPGFEGWSPVVVIANRRSGNGDGQTILSEFRRFLNPVQIIDLSERKPPAALQFCVLLAPKTVRVLVAGGDGTLAWVMTSSHKLDLDPEPPLAIVPLGTGNDLSRVLGWGKENPPEMDAGEVLASLQNARKNELDRWKVEVSSTRHLGLKLPSKTHYMYDYMSVGVDAQVALNFHKTRDGPFYLFGNRIFNKILYLCFGTHQVMTSDCKNLEQRLELYLDGQKTELPELESIVILNIASWGAGVNLWGMCEEGQTKFNQSHRDGVLEVVGIYSSFHIAQLQVGLSTPLRLGQARHVEVRLKGKAPIQIDGEPWEQNPSNISVSFVNKAPVLLGPHYRA